MLGEYVSFAHLHEMERVPQVSRRGFSRPLFTMVAIIVLAKAAFGFFVGWGLLQRENWARTSR